MSSSVYGSMRLVLVGSQGEYIDDVHVQPDEFEYAKEDGGAATLLLGNLMVGRHEPLPVPILVCFSGPEGDTVINECGMWDDPKMTGIWPPDDEDKPNHLTIVLSE